MIIDYGCLFRQHDGFVQPELPAAQPSIQK